MSGYRKHKNLKLLCYLPLYSFANLGIIPLQAAASYSKEIEKEEREVTKLHSEITTFKKLLIQTLRESHNFAHEMIDQVEVLEIFLPALIDPSLNTEERFNTLQYIQGKLNDALSKEVVSLQETIPKKLASLPIKVQEEKKIKREDINHFTFKLENWCKCRCCHCILV
jgi:hypothetical protein